MTKRRIHHAVAFVLASSALALSGCKSQQALEEKPFPMVFNATNDEGDALVGVAISADGSTIGKTDAQGSLRAVLRGAAGEVRDLAMQCPDGYQPPPKMPSIQLRQVRSSSGRGIAPSEVRLTCTAKKRLAALVVRTPGLAGVPVMVHGREVARTDRDGTAHAIVETEGKKDLRVVLDTSAHPLVQPVNPHKDLRVGTTNEVFVFKPELTRLTPRKPPKKKPEAPEVLRPERIR